ncbi:MAG TPA: hypothetical protein VM597_01065 [Gemmataceae bacterium]|nr:hypothetical protein [Gemmataceae bacterium]
MSWLKSWLGEQRPSMKSRTRGVRPRLETLEDRTVPSNIIWQNRGDDRFDDVFGANAELARRVVDAAILDWEGVILDFNYDLLPNKYDLFIKMADQGFGLDADTWNFNRYLQEFNFDFGFEPTSQKPTSASINISRGWDLTGDGRGDGGGYYLDPTPQDHSEFSNPINAFAASAPDDSAAADLIDLYSMISHEIGHAVGHSSYFLLDWPDDFTEDTHRLDTAYGVGTFWTWDSPYARMLMTDNNGGSPPNGYELDVLFVTTGPTHSAPAGSEIEHHGHTYHGVDELMNPVLPYGTRHLISNQTANALADVYEYTIELPERRGTFFASIDPAGVLQVRGGPGASDDIIGISASDSSVVVTMNLGNDNPNLSPFYTYTSVFPRLSVREIAIDAGSGSDQVFIDSLPRGLTLTVRGGPDADLVQLGGPGDTVSGRSLDPIRGQVIYHGGEGSDSLRVNDDAGRLDADVNYAISSGGAAGMTRITRLGRDGIIGYSEVEATHVAATPGNNRIELHGNLSPLSIEGNGGTDELSVAPVSRNLDAVQSRVEAAGVEAVIIDDCRNTRDSRYVLTSPADDPQHRALFYRENSAVFLLPNSANISVRSGGRNDRVEVERQSALGTWSVEGGGGDDTLVMSEVARTVRQSFAGPHALHFDGGTGKDAAIFYDSNAATGGLYFVEASWVGDFELFPWLTYSRVEDLRLEASGGDDTITVLGTPTSLALTIHAGPGHDEIVLGDGSFAFNIGGPVTLDAGGGADLVRIDDTRAAGASRHSLSATRYEVGSRLDRSLTYAGVEVLELDGGAFADTFTVESISAATMIDAGAGNDVIRITPTGGSLNLVNGLVVRGGTGSDHLVVHDRNNPYTGGPFNGRYDVRADAVQRYTALTSPTGLMVPLPVGVTTEGVNRVTLDAGGQADAIRVHRANVTVNAGGGDDVIAVAPDADNWQTAANVTANGEDGIDSTAKTSCCEVVSMERKSTPANVSVLSRSACLRKVLAVSV